jgi:hypothetical protein
MPIKSFKGLIADGEQDTIVLHTNDGSTGYRIVKFMLMPNTPGAVSAEHVVKIYNVEQTTVDGVIDFNDQTVIGAGFTNNYLDAMAYPLNQYTIFDNNIFNQDIYVTHKDVATGQSCNYYIELEQVKLDLNENTVATLKDIRNQA